ncbi:hypothetical protein MNBD_GAMMA12-2402 [hydrothermal vent metagenome]|uniref:Uncharacterized protein n=1 Tax=hydrothermal vent metagenome TaxID=652676 RepID=A0A3B0YVT0_9ZZZZ
MLRRVVGVLLIFGGGYGLLAVVAALGSQLSNAQVFSNILFFLLYIWSVLTGLLVIENQSKGWYWAKIILLMQIPVLKTSIVSFKFMVALSWSADFAATQVRFRYVSGADYMLDFLVRHSLSLGINFVALVLFLLIWRREGG